MNEKKRALMAKKRQNDALHLKIALEERRQERIREGKDPIYGRSPEEWELDPDGVDEQHRWVDEYRRPEVKHEQGPR